ncbi:hypothetical protein ID866_8713 [Astraeus odoratus]|nr:hypothetical protein ID866_8713 [Astraeus odoratus]
MRSDLKRLGPEEYLNDTLIELWLNELREKDPTFADQIHVFSSFFYKKLNKKNTEEGYQSVRKWTSKVDLFSKKYIIVPINENVHWYLAIIYEPGHTLKPPLTHSPSITARATRNRKKERGKTDTEAKPTGLRSQVHGPSPLSDQEPDRGISPKETTHSRTPSVTQDEEMDDGTAATANLPCGDFSLANPTSKSSARAASTVPSDLAYPTSPPREDAMDVDAVEILAERRSPPYLSWSEVPRSSVPVSQFYSSSVSKKKEHNVPGEPVVLDSENEESDRKQEAEVDDMLAVTQPQTLAQTYIFTLDSLGSKHVQAIRVLKNYLAREAKDKRGFDEVRDAIGKQVHVPAQPNTWDCGIYLLHLTKVFMSSPEHHFHLITTTKGTIPSTERKAQWKDEEVPLMREYLSSRITQLSETWKAEKAAKEEEAKKRMSEEVEAEVISSEGEVDIVQVCGDVKGTPQRKRHAARLRG